MGTLTLKIKIYIYIHNDEDNHRKVQDTTKKFDPCLDVYLFVWRCLGQKSNMTLPILTQRKQTSVLINS